MKTNKVLSVAPLGFPWATSDPFLFCAYHRDEYPKGNAQMGPNESLDGRVIGQDFTIKDGWRMYHGSTIPGFPYHPHRGFETITIVKEGVVDHTDSLGAAGRFGAGDVQWMTAGKGIQHSEMFPLIHEDKNNPLEIFQVWLNLPSESKFVAPHFKMLWEDAIPKIKNVDDRGITTEIDIIAGNLGANVAPKPTPDSWAITPENHVSVWTIKMEANATWTLPATSGEAKRTLYFYKGGSLDFEGQTVHVDNAIEVVPTENIVIQNSDSDGYILLLQGKPINEPVVKYGPFVMNTEEEI